MSEAKRRRNLRALVLAALGACLLGLGACGGGGGGANAAQNQSDWDNLVWDQGNWF